MLPRKVLFGLMLWAALEIGLMYWLCVVLDPWTVVYVALVTGVWGISTLMRHGRSLTQEYGDMTRDPARFAADMQADGPDAIKSRYAERMLGMLGGGLLIAPGPLSDLAGVALSIPPLRRLGIKRAGRFMEELPQNPRVQEFVARQGAKFPGGMGPMPGPAGPRSTGRRPSSAPKRGSAVIDTTATDS